MVRAVVILILSSTVLCSLGCQKRARSSGPGPAEQPPPAPAVVVSNLLVDEFQGQPEPILSQSRLLFHIPARALCLVRVPSGEQSRARLAELGLAESLADGGFAGWLQKMLGKISDEGGKDLVDPELLAHFLSDAVGGHGECAVALVPDASTDSRRLDVLAAWALEGEGAPAPPLAALNAASLPQARTNRAVLVSTSKTLLDEASRRGEHGRGSLAASGPFALAWQTAASQDDVVHTYLSLARLWEYLPKELGDASRRLRLNGYESLLYSWRVDAGQCVETLHVGAHDRDHPLRTLLGPATFDGAVLAALPGNARHVSTLGSDDEDLLSRARSLLDPERDHALDECLGLLSQIWKVDFQAELNACVGSELAYATVAAAGGDAPLIAATLRDQNRLQKLFDRVWGNQQIKVTRTEPYKGKRILSFDRQAMASLSRDLPDPLPVFVMLPGRLLAATSVEGMKRALDGLAEGTFAARTDVANMLKSTGGKIVAFSYVAGSGEPAGKDDVALPAMCCVQLDDLSVTVHGTAARPGLKALSSAAVFESLAAMLVPEIEKLRIDGNEQAAVDLLRRIHAAERDFAAAALVDRDGDHTGEYGFLDELMGVAPARGGTRIADPPLKGALEDAGNGCGAASGYYFEVLLPGTRGVPVAATARESVDANLAERAFRVYAWPRENGKVGKHAFVVDSDGEIFATSNEGAAQAYSGLESRPRGDAFGEGKGTLLAPGSGPVRQGRDGGLWVSSW